MWCRESGLPEIHASSCLIQEHCDDTTVDDGGNPRLLDSDRYFPKAPENADGAIPGSELERSLGNAYPRRQKVIDPSTGEFVDFECPAFEDTKQRRSEVPEPADGRTSPVDGEPPAAP